MHIEQRFLSVIKPYERNPRINDAAVEAVAESIRRFGFRQPIVVDPDGVIVCGHTRWKAAQKLGLEKVPVHVARDLTPEQIRAYRIADNKTAELAEWNLELLPLELAELEGAGIDWALLGFDADDLARLMDAAHGVQPGLTDPDEIPEPPDEATTRPGDLWILGEHRLLCGDSASAADVDRLLHGQPIHLVNMDPPYNVKVEPRSNNAIAAGLSSFQAAEKKGAKTLDAKGLHHSGFDVARGKTGIKHHQKLDLERHPEKAKATHRKMRAKDRPLANDFVSDEAFDALLHAWFGNAARVLLPGRAAYIWGGYANCANYPPVLKAVGLYFSQAIIWVKEHPVLTRKDFMGNHEWCQPPDTQVLTAAGSSQLQFLRNGDRVVSFSRSSSAIVGLRHGLEARVTSRTYRGPLYGVAVGNRETWCTDGHIWSARMTPAAKSLWCVYLMQRDSWWRVGRCRVYSTWGFGLKQRLQTEGGEAAWILSTYESKEQATLAEQMISITYGIPTTFWTETRASRRTATMIRQFYEVLDPDALERSARRALRDHHRSVYHPFLTRRESRHKHGCRTSLLVRACNLLPHAMAVPVPGRRQKFSWTPIRAVDVQSYAGPVHSMDVEKHHHYIADGIVTHNCFYTWKEGAAHVFLGPNNATDVWSVKKVNPQSMEHLTQKPVELAVRAIQYSSRPGEHVLDLFAGSGSTLIAAEQTGRRCFTIELDPLYVDVVIDRWQRFSGKRAIREGDQMLYPKEPPATREALR